MYDDAKTKALTYNGAHQHEGAGRKAVVKYVTYQAGARNVYSGGALISFEIPRRHIERLMRESSGL